jgi:hypothetical protein
MGIVIGRVPLGTNLRNIFGSIRLAPYGLVSGRLDGSLSGMGRDGGKRVKLI